MILLVLHTIYENYIKTI